MILPSSALFIGAHCDDIELFAGGLLSRLCRSGTTRIGVLVFSDHGGVLPPERARLAQEEFRANMAWLRQTTGADIRDHSGPMLAACQGAFEAQRATIYAAMEALRDEYGFVVSHAVTDTNQDHQQVAREARRVFKAHATLLGGEFPNNDLGEFPAQVYVGLDSVDVEAKARMIEGYHSQRADHRPYLDSSLTRALARVRGAQAGCAAAEAFSISGRLIVR